MDTPRRNATWTRLPVSGRRGVPAPRITLQLPDDLLAWLQTKADQAGKPVRTYVRDVLAAHAEQ